MAGASYELLHTIPVIITHLPQSAAAWSSREAHEAALQKTLLEYLVRRPDITVYGDTTGSPEVRVSTVSFRVAGWSSQDVVETVEAATNYGFRWGNFYSPRLVHELLGLPEDGVVRVSMGHYNTGELSLLVLPRFFCLSFPLFSKYCEIELLTVLVLPQSTK